MPGQQLHHRDLHGVAALRRWDNGQLQGTSRHETLLLGVLPDGRWWITWTTQVHKPPLAFPDEVGALAAVDWVIRHSPHTWTEVPVDWQPATRACG
jgi:hypothetical protein